MSYSIGHLIYGLPVTTEVSEKAKELGLNLGVDEIGDGTGYVGFDLLYTGGDYESGYLGKEISSFHVCVDFHKASEFERKLLNIEIREVLRLIKTFQTNYPKLAEIYSDNNIEVDYYIVWGSS